MALAKGIKVQPSRFSALNIDSDSDSEASAGDWFEVVGKAPKSKSKDAGTKQQTREVPGATRPLSKSAKKRARKKRNQQSSSSEAKGGVGVDEGKDEGIDEEHNRQERETEAADLQFQKEMEEAILQSKLAAEREKEIEMQRRAAAALKKQTKKGVKLSLQSLHRGDIVTESQTFNKPEATETVDDSSAFFDRLHQEVDTEIKKRKQTERKISESQMSPVEESARVAHVMDELEKREKMIVKLREENESLKGQLKEVKGRNQQLCKMLGQGEFSEKTQLLEQIDQLSTVKNELTIEVERLHSQLEQERSRNKSLQSELTKTSKNGKHR